MSRIKAKFHLTKGNRSVLNLDGAAGVDDLSECKKFYAHLESKMTSVLRPSRHLHSQVPLLKNNKQENYHYEEKGFVDYLNRFCDSLTGHVREAIQAMVATYQQIADLKSQRDSNMRTEVFSPIKETTLKEISNIQKLQRLVIEAQNQLAAAERNREKDGSQQATDRRDQAFRSHSEATERLKKAIIEFKQDEPKRITFLQASAEAQLEYHKWAMEAFTKLVSELRTIRGNAADNVPNTTLDASLNGGTTYYDKPQSNFGYAAVVKRTPSTAQNDAQKTTKALTNCKALYDFEAEQDDDLSFKKGDIATILEKVDDQWYFGEKDGRRGHFPVEFVQVLE
ncbi:endophilin A3 [Echinococcus multilocularis]|uniref:Endophilin A3 n=1 Tax=Echinococcus multilocularis TaxID=6211 RepID=A0A068YLA3_ECHMU|nr:endophilin A3 [Echinococcus multilocularis]